LLEAQAARGLRALAHRALAFSTWRSPLKTDAESALRKGWWHAVSPKVEARILQDVGLRPHERVLDKSASGSGWMAAAARARRSASSRFEIRLRPAKLARENLQRAGIANVEVRQADGSKGIAAEGPFDVIVLSGSVRDVPQALLAQLKVGGRLAAIVGSEPVMRATFVTRTGEASYGPRSPGTRWRRAWRTSPSPRASTSECHDPQVRPADWNDWLQAQPARPLLLDVREPWEVQTASVRPRRSTCWPSR
jgi:protein-L-isoaspartate(D-aspartate) O-methyltransferase